MDVADFLLENGSPNRIYSSHVVSLLAKMIPEA